MLNLKILLILIAFFSTGQAYEEIHIKRNEITIELKDGITEKYYIPMISPEPAIYEEESTKD